MAFCEISILHAKFTVNLDWFKNQDPFVRITYNGQTYETSVRNGAGLEAEWKDEQFVIEDVGSDCLVQFTAYDSDLLRNEVIGQSSGVPLGSLKHGVSMVHLFNSENTKTGSMKVRVVKTE